jgi:6-phosphogluconolactonase
LAVSGGTTPGVFLRDLGEQSLPWPRVHVTLTDERWVPAGHPRANATLVSDTLLAGAARNCRWQPLYCDGLARLPGVTVLNEQLADFGWPLDVAVLGMGEDGHVASLFPDAATWNAPDLRTHVIAATSPTGEERVSLTLATLRGARHRYLLLHGARKAAVLRTPASLPVGALINDACPPVIAFMSLEDAP